jgi:ribonuclease J
MKLYTLGGYNEVGKNMSAVEVRDDIVILDAGYHMEELMEFDGETESASVDLLKKENILPDDSQILKQREKVKAIVIGHAHLDHVGGVAAVASHYDCPIIASPYTMKIAEEQIRESKRELPNERIILEPGEIRQITANISVEFVKVTHSIPDAMLTLLHTREGRIAYGLDFRLDQHPVLGEPTDTERLSELGESGVKLLIGDSTRAGERNPSLSEKMVREQLKYKLDEAYRDHSAVAITTFSSHIERLKSILQANAGRRKVAFIGRSLKEYLKPAEELGMIDTRNAEIVSYKGQVNELFEEVGREPGQWLLVCTGNQGEARSVMSRLSKGEYSFKLRKGDHVIFSSRTIPTELNRAERYRLERDLRALGVTLHLDIHASGHGHREELRYLMKLLKPEIMIPGHGDIHKLAEHASLAQELGYVLNENLFICENGNVLEL